MSIFFPAYNDWGTIASLVVLAAAVVRDLTDDWEIIVVNDASPDHTPLILGELLRYVPHLRIVEHERNRGYGGALRSGFAAATKEYIFYTDGDAQYDVRELRSLWENRADADLVNGYKIARADPLHRIIIGRIYHHIVRLAFRLHVVDVDCDFRLLRRSVFERVELTRDSGVICVELMTKIEKNGFRIAEVPVHHYHRLHGRSQFFNFRRVFQVLRELGVLWWELIVQRKVTRPA
ncbi:MAG: glycosyltransferase family 2 protein [Deltaproteobacteria bacterium]|nr:MAG: glycosyltransferase family 2 protein [Deltaproteobacteria bacterium]